MFASVILILTYEQLWLQYPEASVTQADFETQLVCDSYVININDVVCTTTPPLHLHKFHEHTQSVISLSTQVK